MSGGVWIVSEGVWMGSECVWGCINTKSVGKNVSNSCLLRYCLFVWYHNSLLLSELWWYLHHFSHYHVIPAIPTIIAV